LLFAFSILRRGIFFVRTIVLFYPEKET